MLRRSCVRLLALFAVLAGGSSPGQLRADGDRPALPFWGVAEGVVTGVIPPNGLVVAYTGTATHLGRFTREERLFLNPDGSFTGTIVFTAADGDALSLDLNGAFTSPTTAVGTYTFTGGTGRFRGATGAASFVAYTPDGVHVAVSFEGTIRY